MSNPYKRMYVLSEEEYIRLKTLQKPPSVDNVHSNRNEEPHVVEEPCASNESPAVEASQRHFVCQICGKAYKQKRELRRHVQNNHKPPEKAVILKRIHSIESQEASPPKVPLSVSLPTIVSNTIDQKSKTKKQQKKKHKIIKVKAFDNIKKWMTMRD